MYLLIRHSTRIILKLETMKQLYEWEPNWQEFNGVVHTIVDEYSMVSNTDASLATTDDVLKHSQLFIRDALIFWVFSDAIRHEDVGLMWLVYTFWLFMFRGIGCHNYGNKILEMFAQFRYEMSEELQRVTERTWLVNRWGKPGRAIPTDLYLEHNNGFIKVWKLVNLRKDTDPMLQNMFAALGSCASISYIQNKCSGPVDLLRRLSRDVATYFNVTDINRTSSTVNTDADIRALVMDLKDAKVHTFSAGRAVTPVGPNKGTGVIDILTQGKEALERGAFWNWKDRTGKLGADVFGCDEEYRHQQGVGVGDCGLDGEAGTNDDKGDVEMLVVFDPLVDDEMENEI